MRHPDDRRASEARLSELIAAESELTQQQTAAAPSCERVCPLARNIRELSKMICDLAQRHPDDDVLAAHCHEAAERAARARTRIPPTCPCIG